MITELAVKKIRTRLIIENKKMSNLTETLNCTYRVLALKLKHGMLNNHELSFIATYLNINMDFLLDEDNKNLLE